jgi:hypothetical protein
MKATIRKYETPRHRIVFEFLFERVFMVGVAMLIIYGTLRICGIVQE